MKLELSQFSIDEPLTSEMKAKMRSELKQNYRSSRKSAYGQKTKLCWTTYYGDSGMFTLQNPVTPLQYWTLLKFCDKPTAFY